MSSNNRNKNQKIQEESFGGDSEDRGSFDDKYLKPGTLDSDSGLENALKKKKRSNKKDTNSKGGFFKKTSNKYADQGDDDDDDLDDDEIEVDNRQSGASEGQKSNRDYDIDMNLKGNEQPSLILYKYRWVVLFAYFLTSTATGAV